jgi:hypothetical protein
VKQLCIKGKSVKIAKIGVNRNISSSLRLKVPSFNNHIRQIKRKAWSKSIDRRKKRVAGASKMLSHARFFFFLELLACSVRRAEPPLPEYRGVIGMYSLLPSSVVKVEDEAMGLLGVVVILGTGGAWKAGRRGKESRASRWCWRHDL